ncbi:MAG TPA: BON domain-containing protein, partial [Dehalococcoidia bacterium]|nr:BON domain-containing protein [Dehalococcoidia bacterium]
LAAYYFDAHQGRRRRALMRDKLAHFRNVLTREVPERASRRARFFGGVAKGVRHYAMELVRPEDGRVEDDETLVARVRSEVLRDPRYKPGEIHIDAYKGCVTLRGQLDNPGDIQRLVSATRDVDGVREVRSYLHLPDTLPPNKADVYRASEAHLPAI